MERAIAAGRILPSNPQTSNSPAKHGSSVSVIDGDVLAFEVVIPFFEGF
jgi:hypothetical protein